MDQDETRRAGRLQPWPHCVKWGPSSLPQKRRAEAPQFSAHFYCGQTAGCIKMPLGMEIGLGPGHIVLEGLSSPQRKGHSPRFSAHIYCGQTAGNIVLDGDTAPPKGTQPRQFSAHVCCDQMAVCIRIPLGTEVGLSLGDIALDGDPAPPLKGHSPQFLALLLTW